MANRNVRWLVELMYDLEHEYGEPITYNVVQKVELDIIHGTSKVNKLTYRIKKAIRLSTILDNKDTLSRAFVESGRNFAYGSAVNTETVTFLINKKQLPPGVQLELDNYIFAKHERFTIKDAKILEHGCGWLVTCQHHKGSIPFEPMQLSVKNYLQYQQEVVNA